MKIKKHLRNTDRLNVKANCFSSHSCLIRVVVAIGNFKDFEKNLRKSKAGLDIKIKKHPG